jgi:hypothetical protein
VPERFTPIGARGINSDGIDAQEIRITGDGSGRANEAGSE